MAHLLDKPASVTARTAPDAIERYCETDSAGEVCAACPHLVTVEPVEGSPYLDCADFGTSVYQCPRIRADYRAARGAK